MKNIFTLTAISFIMALSIIIGKSVSKIQRPQPLPDTASVPYIGSIEVLNGCGVSGAANKVAYHLRKANFDVKNVENASDWNYPFTLVISRKTDTAIANQIAKILKTDKMIIIRNDDNLYDVTVYAGPDFGERIQ